MPNIVTFQSCDHYLPAAPPDTIWRTARLVLETGGGGWPCGWSLTALGSVGRGTELCVVMVTGILYT